MSVNPISYLYLIRYFFAPSDENSKSAAGHRSSIVRIYWFGFIFDILQSFALFMYIIFIVIFIFIVTHFIIVCFLQSIYFNRSN